MIGVSQVSGVSNGGLGARSASEHAPAAYISSLAQTQTLCTLIWPSFDELHLDGGLLRSDVESSLSSAFLPMLASTTRRVLLPRRACRPRLRPRFVIICSIPLLMTVTELPTSASTAQVPGSSPCRILSTLTSLPMSIWSQGHHCTLLGQVMDRWGDHALVCSCGGDRVIRHNIIRDVVHSASNDSAGLGSHL